VDPPSPPPVEDEELELEPVVDDVVPPPWPEPPPPCDEVELLEPSSPQAATSQAKRNNKMESGERARIVDSVEARAGLVCRGRVGRLLAPGRIGPPPETVRPDGDFTRSSRA
jgi:hypothetical protein